jgi:hypothetical protein
MKTTRTHLFNVSGTSKITACGLAVTRTKVAKVTRLTTSVDCGNCNRTHVQHNGN